MLNDGLLRFKESQKYLAVDVETEGLSLVGDRPVQIAWIVFTLKETLEEHSARILWPDCHVAEEAARITHFNKEQYLKEARPAADVLKEFDPYLYNPEYMVVMHNGLSFDGYMHRNWRRECGQPEDFSWQDRFLDTNCLAKAYKKGWKIDRDNLKANQYRLSRYIERGLRTSLGTLNKEWSLGHDESGLHDALADLRLNIDVFKYLVYHMDI